MYKLACLLASFVLHKISRVLTRRTPTERFEVDGANAARNFLKKEASHWDKHRSQLVWDAIALHTTTSIAVGILSKLFLPHKYSTLSPEIYLGSASLSSSYGSVLSSIMKC